MIFRQNDGTYCICTSFGRYFNILYDVTLTSAFFCELYHLRDDLTCLYMQEYE